MYNIKNTKFKLKQLRLAHGYTQNEVVEKINIKQTTYKFIENSDTYNTTIENYLKLANLYNISLDYLFNDDYKPELNKELVDLNMFKTLTEYKNLDLSIVDDDNNELLIPDTITTKSLHKNVDHTKIEYNFYPFTLLNAIYGKDVIYKNLKITSNLIEDLDLLLNKYLTKREAYVMKSRFINKLTLEEVAKLNNVTRERIRQIEARSIRKLRHPAVCELILYNTKKEYNEALRQLNLLKIQIQQHKDKLSKYNVTPVTKSKELKTTILDTSIEDLDFSIRTYNCLTRAKLNTVDDVLNQIIDSNILKIRNFGKRSFFEVLSRLEELKLIKYNHDIKNPILCIDSIILLYSRK